MDFSSPISKDQATLCPVTSWCLTSQEWLRVSNYSLPRVVQLCASIQSHTHGSNIKTNNGKLLKLTYYFVV